MKKQQFIDAPVLKAAKDAILTEINLEALQDVGGRISYSIKVGDIIEFPDSAEDISLFKRETAKGSDRFEYLIGVLRNGKPSWLSLGSLRRTDINRNLYGDVPNAFKGQTDQDRVTGLLGKKITAESEIDVKLAVFGKDGNLLAGEEREGKLPVINFV